MIDLPALMYVSDHVSKILGYIRRSRFTFCSLLCLSRTIDNDFDQKSTCDL